MKSRTALWIGSHLAVVAIAYGMARTSRTGDATSASGEGQHTKASSRDRIEDERENAALLAAFVETHQSEAATEANKAPDSPPGSAERWRGFQAQPRNADRPPQDVMNDFVYGELNRFFNEGRDWRFEFRHGKATLDEVVAAVRAGMPEIPPEGEEKLTVSLFRQLVEEDREKAMPLLDSLPDDKKREALFHSTWLSQVNIKPDDFLAFCRSLPEPVADWEKDLRTKGWNWKARGFLMRYGDDYVEWVKGMPEGLDKETAMNSLIWATREQNPEEARKLSEALYPPKSK
jgi:hypothetical protein